MQRGLVGSEMCIRDRYQRRVHGDADHYLSILIFIIIKAQVPDLFTHVCLTNEFATLGSSSSYNAYCLTTLQACFYHILNVDVTSLLLTRNTLPTLPKASRKQSIDKDPPMHLACLLYTSPSPRDLSTSRMPSSA
eukprot:TRINITY_DN25530_c0_g1_i1.p1 TRINITY_DN25530_c0_g1~~TRINITY_DN25530_c0_g1_i1.p1  ORF type:complete len:135 (+),score=31.34 TRINITY_DN25530_c0_g1_i1:113-517(+)